MLETYKQLTANQYESALCMLYKGIELCPDELWNKPIVNLLFSQAFHHTLIYTDIYLGRTLDELKTQPFHREHVEQFGDYEELEDRPQVARYERDFIIAYFNHCRSKARDVMAAETEESLKTEPGCDWLPFSRAEVHIYNIRHIQHHAAQIGLRLAQQTNNSVPWVGNGWRD